MVYLSIFHRWIFIYVTIRISDCNLWRFITSAELPDQAARYGHVAHTYTGYMRFL